ALLPSPGLALDLIESGRLLPVLDGFDELPQPVRAEALTELRRTLADPARAVLTSREAEYVGAVNAAHGLPVPGARAIRLRPLTPRDVAAYLPRTSARTNAKWRPVLRRLTDSADTARDVRTLRAVLRTPLMVALARVAYSESDDDPAELLDTHRFTTRKEVERHLYDGFLAASYGRDAPQATRWAAFLAAQLRDARQQDLAWWRLDGAMPGAVRALSLLPSAVVAALTVHLLGVGPPLRLPAWLLTGLGLYVIYVADLLFGEQPREPQQIRRHRPARKKQQGQGQGQERQGWPGGIGWAGRTIAPNTVTWLFLPLFFVALHPEAQERLPLGRVTLLAALPAVVLVLFLDRLRTTADPDAAVEPERLLRLDRRSVLTLGTVALGVTRRNGNGSTEVPPLRSRCCVGLLPLPPAWWVLATTLVLWHVYGGYGTLTAGSWLLAVAGAALSAFLHDLALSAWGRFTLARAWWASRGRLPWRLMEFLRDAHRRGVLRQAGGVYRFRHIELRNRLAEVHTPPAWHRKRLGRTRRRYGPAFRITECIAALLLIPPVLGTWIAPPPWLIREIPAACSLLDRQGRRALLHDPQVVIATDATCRLRERSSNRPRIEVDVTLKAEGNITDIWDRAAPARKAFELSLHSARRRPVERSRIRTDIALADEAFRVVTPPSPEGDTAQARFVAREKNLLIEVRYAEEDGTVRRVTAVAESLLREALSHR
ncbi:hypothetical protein G5C65_20760, partial [Streptomyces sp. SB3404]|nr:hypothetical protein [Streptomyces boncukensis]